MRGLYAIVDPEHCAGRDPLWIASEILHGGCAALQLRAKNMPDRQRLDLARALVARCRDHGVPFWMNDRVDIALLCNADGVHLGQDDVPIADARQLLPRASLGLSTHDIEQALHAEASGADVIGFGPIFDTRSKQRPDPCVGLQGLRKICEVVEVPVVAIGGIELTHAAAIAETGASYAAVIGAICRADDPRAAARALHDALRAG